MQKIMFKRIIRSGYLTFRRNGWLSTATILVSALALFMLGNLIILSAFASTIFSSFESRIDISVYFIPTATDQEIVAIKQDIETLPSVKNVSYISKEQALADFRERHKGNALIADALNQLDDNPLRANINITANDSSQYATINDYLVSKNYPSVDKINYFENKAVIDRLSSMIATIRNSGVVAVIVLSFIAVLVAFNTIRLAIYTMREEISVMRLVGATRWFSRGPFLVAGLLYGTIAALVVTLIFFPLTWFASPKLLTIVPNFNLFEYFTTNIVQFFLIMLFSGVALCTLSSVIATRRYLKA